MMGRATKVLFFALFVFVVAGVLPLDAQESISSKIAFEHPPEKKPFEFPQWAKDIRRADIIAFGVFPFAWLFTSIFVDIARAGEHNWDWSYYTGIGSSSGAKAWENEDYERSLLITAAVAASVALIDFIIIKIKRTRAEKKASALAPNESEVTRSPISGTRLNQMHSSMTDDPSEGVNLFTPAAALSLHDSAAAGIDMEVY
jgi:hypothetical protein